MSRTIRQATINDIPDILSVFEDAKQKMRDIGNTEQWSDGYPSTSVVASDIERKGGFVIEDRKTIIAYFAFIPAPEPTYAQIYGGQWIDDEQPYYVIHRLASRKGTSGVFATMMNYCQSKTCNIRIDTHRRNSVMKYNIGKFGFKYCGIIHLANGDERLAFQRIITRLD